MEENGVCGGHRTWQSMKEHFRKQVIQKIHQFGLTARQIRKFRAAYDLDVAPSSESDESVNGTDDNDGPPAEKRPRTASPGRPSPRRTLTRTTSSVADVQLVHDDGDLGEEGEG